MTDIQRRALGDAFKGLRESRGVERACLAKRCSVEASDIAAFESGDKTPSLEFLFVVAATLDASASAILANAERRLGGARAFKPLKELTPRELDVVALVSEGNKNSVVAAYLGTTEQVVKNWLRSIYWKCRVGNRLQLALLVKRYPEFAATVRNARRRLRLAA